MLFPPGDDRRLAALLTQLATDRARLAALRPQQPPTIAGNVDRLLELYADVRRGAAGRVTR